MTAICSILMFAVIGARIDAPGFYWFCFAVYSFARLVSAVWTALDAGEK